MVRTLLLAAVAAVGLTIPLNAPARADTLVVTEPAAVVVYGHHHHHFRVYYKASPWSPWFYYGRYEHLRHAERTASFLRAQGFAVRIR